MKKLILISALLFSFNGWAEEIYLECESNGSRLMHNTEWINNSCEITEKIKNYYKILDSSWYGIYREETYNYDDDDISSYKDGQYCGTTVEPFDVLISKAKRTGKAVGWRENISRKNILWETSSEYMEKFAQEAVTLSDDKIILRWVTGILLHEPYWEVDTYVVIDRLTGAVSGNSTESCSAITKEKYKEVTEHWDKSVKEILKIEKDYLKHNRKF